MKQILFLSIIFLLCACQPMASNGLSATPSKEVSTTTATATKSRREETPPATETYTPSPSETPTNLPPQYFDPSGIKTVTPASPAQCSKELSGSKFDVKKAVEISGSDPYRKLSYQIRDFLNSGGTMQSVLSAWRQIYGAHNDSTLQIQDVTGDGVSELILVDEIWIDIVGCQNGRYQVLFMKTSPSDLYGVSIISVTDINRDGLPEIVVYFNGCMGNRCPSINIFEWNGNDFQDLIGEQFSFHNCSSLTLAPFAVDVQDVDHNGTKEIILRNDGEIQPDMDFPYRQETRICMWNGHNIVVYKTEFDAPYYRFQAVQDGDRATLAGDYKKALSFYQQAILDKKLEWFTEEKRLHDFRVYSDKYFGVSDGTTPTSGSSLVPDPDEYPNLAAYARYRIMLLYVLQGDLSDAATAYQTIQQSFPAQKPESYFSKLATIFWTEYQTSKNIKSTCDKVVLYVEADAATYPDILNYLGSHFHGAQSIEYTPESICPFK